MRRVLYIIREEYMGALKTESESKSLDAQPPKSSSGGPPNSSSRSYQSRSLGTILTPGTDTDLSIPITDLKLVTCRNAFVLCDDHGCLSDYNHAVCERRHRRAH